MSDCTCICLDIAVVADIFFKSESERKFLLMFIFPFFLRQQINDWATAHNYFFVCFSKWHMFEPQPKYSSTLSLLLDLINIISVATMVKTWASEDPSWSELGPPFSIGTSDRPLSTHLIIRNDFKSCWEILWAGGGRENVNLNQWENKISLLCPPNGHCSYLFPFCQTECREHRGAQTFHP